MSFVWQKEVFDYQYGPPKRDDNSGSHRGGNPNRKIDIFIQDVGAQGLYGYCTSDDPKIQTQNNISAYCVFDDDFSKKQFGGAATGVAALKVTAAHEFNHAIQFNYDAFEDIWFLEATATNMEADVYPAIHDNYQYFTASPLSKTNPHRPIDRWASDRPVRLLDSSASSPSTSPTRRTRSRPLPDPTFVHEIWVDAKAVPGTINGGEYSTEAIETFLGAHGETFPPVSGSSASRTPRRPPGTRTWRPLQHTGGAGLHGKHGRRRLRRLSRPGNDAHVERLLVLQARTGASSLDIDANFPSPATSPRATVLSFDSGGGFVQQQITLDMNGDGPVTGLTFDSTVTKVVVVVTNASTRFTQCFTDFKNAPFFSCAGKPQDDSAPNAYQLDIAAP